MIGCVWVRRRWQQNRRLIRRWPGTVSYTHLRAHETVLDLVCRLLLEKKKPTYHNSLTYVYAVRLTADTHDNLKTHHTKDE